MGGYGNYVAYKNKQRRHFLTEVIRVFTGGEELPDGTARDGDRRRSRREWG